VGTSVGVCQVWLRMPENHSLKDKRRVVKSLLARIHNKFNVAASEIANQDSWQTATIGITCISHDDRHVDEVMASVYRFIQRERLDAEVLDVQTEILRP
jgi:uncharacterized protein